MTQIRETIINSLIDINPVIADYLEEDFLETHLIDSFEIVNLIMALEDAFDIVIDPDLVYPGNFRTIDAIEWLIESILRA